MRRMETTLNRVAAVLAAGMLLGTAACGGGDSESASESGPTQSGEPSSAAASSSAPPEPAKLGVVQDTPVGTAVALKVDPDVRTDETVREALGDERWAGALVKSCLSADHEKAEGYSWAAWTLRDAGGGVYESLSGTTGPRWPQPTYPDGRMLQPGSCFKGWIVFAVAKQTKIDTVVYEGASVPEPLTWKVA